MASSRKSQPGKDLRARVSAVISQHVRRGDRLVAGLSGGVDSVTLIEVLKRLSRRAGFKLAALHVNHQINPAAASWARFCRAYCRRLGVPLKVVKVDVPPGASLEAAARTARYAALMMAPAEFVVLAHNLDDQAETVLLQLLRGAGVKGASAMPVLRIEERGARSEDRGLRIEDRGLRIEKSSKSLSSLNRNPQSSILSPAVLELNPQSSILNPAILRPLLEIPRSDIEAYALLRKLAWIEDDSNADVGFDRNFMRHCVLPIVAQRFPAYRRTLLRASRNFAEASQLIDELARADAQFTGNGLDVAALRRLSVPRAKNVVRHFIRSCGVMMPNATLLAECVRQARRARAGPSVIDMGDHELRCYAGELRLVYKAASPARDFCRAWNGESQLHIPELGGTLLMTKCRGSGISLAKLAAAAITVRVRQGGERLRVHARRPRRSLKNLLQETHVPPWLRARVPLLFCGEALVCVPGIGIDTAFHARRDERGIEPAWQAYTGLSAG
jgi:tRNA(Ile)-lysidine synthase